MGRPTDFTPADIAVIGEMRAQGASWRAIEARLGRPNQNCCRMWTAVLGHPAGWARPRGRSAELSLSRGGGPTALPARHRVAWGAIAGGAGA